MSDEQVEAGAVSEEATRTFAVTRGGKETLVEVPVERIESLTERFAKAGTPFDPPNNVTAQASAEAWLVEFLNSVAAHLHPTPDPGLSEEEREIKPRQAGTMPPPLDPALRVEKRNPLLAEGFPAEVTLDDMHVPARLSERWVLCRRCLHSTRPGDTHLCNCPPGQTPDPIEVAALRSNQPDSSKAGATARENSQAEEQSDDKAVHHPPAVGGEAEAPSSDDGLRALIAELRQDAIKYRREEQKTKGAETEDRASGKIGPDETYIATWNYYQGLWKAYDNTADRLTRLLRAALASTQPQETDRG